MMPFGSTLTIRQISEFARTLLPRRRVVGLLVCHLVVGRMALAVSLDNPGELPAELRSRLANSCEIHWQNVPLRNALDRLGDSHKVPILLDRRIDPELPVSFQSPPGGLETNLAAFAAEHQWDVSVLAPVVYLGPAATARQLATHYEQQQQVVLGLSQPQQRKWRTLRASEWPTPTEPKRLIEQWVAAHQLELRGLDQIPHDLWAGRQWPPMTPLQRLTLVLAGFDLAVEVTPNGEGHIIRLPRDGRLSASYPWPPGRVESITDLQAELSPTTEATVHERQLTVTGTVEQHRIAQAWLARRSSRPAGDSRPPRNGPRANQRFTLTVKNQPIATVLEAIVAQTDLQVTWTPATSELKARRVSLEVRNVTLAQLLEQLLAGSGANYQLQRNQLTIVVSP